MANHLEPELGLVDEAKATVEKWMARWIEVVSLPEKQLMCIVTQHIELILADLWT